MPDDRWQRVKKVFAAALERPRDARGAYLREACGDDDGLRREVESLLAARSEAGEFLSAPARAEGGGSSSNVSPDYSGESVTVSRRLAVGTRLGPYEVVSFLGAGGMGEVYKARDTRLDRTVAVKLLRADLAGDPDRARRFEHEAHAISRLNHPHICALYDVGQHGGSSFLVMEYLEGESLADRLSKGPLPLDEGLRYATQIAEALDEAHQHGIVHRDLKPANVVLTRKAAKLLDFGIAKMRSSAGRGELTQADTRTGAGLIVGTPHYMAPEQLESKAVDERTDIFAFGLLLYEMVSGRKPFEAASDAAFIACILKGEPRPLSEVQPLAPPALEAVVQHCLARDPAGRWSSAGELLSALHGLEQDKAVPPRLPQPSTASSARATIGGRSQTMEEVKAAHEQAVLKPPRGPSIAVLPLASMSPDPDDEYFSDGISEEIINALTRIDGLHVAARTSSFAFKRKSVEVGDIAKRLNVRHVLEGSVRKAGNRVRVTAQLVDATSGYQLWSERYDRQLADIFDVQDEIARAIVERLKVALAAGAASRFVKVTTSNMDAYEQYLKGRAMLYRRGPWIAQALESFQKAVALDPEYAQAWAGLADAHTTLGYYGYRRPEGTMPAALEAATRAMAADPASAEGHNAVAVAALLWERDFERAEREFREALTLNPRYMQARCWYGLFFLQWGVGRLAEGLAEAWAAFEADPLSSYVATVLSFALATVHRFDEAVHQARVAVQYDPESFLARWELGLAYHWNGQPQEAIAVLEPLWAESTHNWVAMALVPTYMQAGREDQARGVHQSLLARQAREYVQPFVLAVCATALADHEVAIGFCETAVDGRDMLFALLHRWWPDFARVRADPRFDDIVHRFNSRGSHRHDLSSGAATRSRRPPPKEGT